MLPTVGPETINKENAPIPNEHTNSESPISSVNRACLVPARYVYDGMMCSL